MYDKNEIKCLSNVNHIMNQTIIYVQKIVYLSLIAEF